MGALIILMCLPFHVYVDKLKHNFSGLKRDSVNIWKAVTMMRIAIWIKKRQDK